MGDFNVDLLKSNVHKATNTLYGCITSYHYLPAITRPTRITPHSATLIDNLFTNAWMNIIDSTILISDISDHLPILVTFDFECSKPISTSSENLRNFSEVNKKNFRELISCQDWTPVTKLCHEGNVNGAYDLFITTYKMAYDKSFPQNIRKGKKQVLKKPWMTTALLKSSKKKEQLYLKYIKNPNEINRSKFVTYRNKFKTIRLKAERYYYATEFNKCNNDLKKTWSLIRTITNTGQRDKAIESIKLDGTKIVDAEIIANKLNNYFVSIAQVLADKIPNSVESFNKYLKPSSMKSFGLNLTTSTEVLNISQTIHTTHSKGMDDIDPCIAGPNVDSIAIPLAEIINCSFNTGIFPEALKIAKVIPIYKKGERDNLTNYRPISILPYFSKIFEKIMYTRLYDFTIKTNILFPSQHGFQSGHSPYMSLLSMQDKISNAIDNNEYSLGIFFDLAKAFDTVNHNILLSKLNNYGIRGLQLSWFSSYLDRRQQCVETNGKRSAHKIVQHGVPQGSNLGPLLFLLYINDLPTVSNRLFFILFADDTNVFFSHKCLETLFQLVNEELAHIAEWFNANKLSLNLDKTNYILFKSYRKTIPPGNHKLNINGTTLSEVSSTKFLGVYVDCHLTWEKHIANIASKISRNIGVIARTAQILPRSIRTKLYYSLIYPYISYCNIVWASTYKSRLYRLEILQKRVVRLIMGVPYGSHTSPIFKFLGILNIDQVGFYQIGEFMFRFNRNLLPSVFRNFFVLSSDVHSHFTRNSNLYHSTYARTNIRLFSIKSIGVTIWNKIPQKIRISPSIWSFKKNLRAHLLEV